MLKDSFWHIAHIRYIVETNSYVHKFDNEILKI